MDNYLNNSLLHKRVIFLCIFLVIQGSTNDCLARLFSIFGWCYANYFLEYFREVIDLYSSIAEKKVFQEAATHSGISSGVIRAAWDAAGEGD